LNWQYNAIQQRQAENQLTDFFWCKLEGQISNLPLHKTPYQFKASF
jgi:hypothetical protein